MNGKKSLLHSTQRIRDGEFRTRLLLDFINAYTRSEFCEGETSSFTVDFEDAL